MEQRKMGIVRVGMILTAFLMVVVGAMRGEVQTVFAKAIKLCLECVGIG